MGFVSTPNSSPATRITLPDDLVVALPDGDVVTLPAGDYVKIGTEQDGAFWRNLSFVRRSQNNHQNEFGGLYWPKDSDRPPVIWVAARAPAPLNTFSHPAANTMANGLHSRAAYVGDLTVDLAAKLRPLFPSNS